MAKHMRLPNGFGQISKLGKKNLRNPYRAMITVGKTEEGKPICKLLKPKAYFRTYNEAYEALLEYNKNPYDLDDVISVEELYDKWTSKYFKTLTSDSSIRTITSAWKYCTSVYSMQVRDLRARHIKSCIDNAKTPAVKSRVKSMFNIMLDYALEYEIVDKNYARTFSIDKNIILEKEKDRTEHISFTNEEMKILWDNKDLPYVDIILIQCYMGWRPKELCLLKIKNVDLDKNIIIGGMKTDAGKNRKVPIHSCIIELVKKRYDEAVLLRSEYLINATDSKNIMLTYDKYRHRFDSVIKRLKLNENHRSHDPRKHFVTICKNAGVDEYALKYLVGHSINDITEKIYTDRDPDWLKNEIEKIKPV